MRIIRKALSRAWSWWLERRSRWTPVRQEGQTLAEYSMIITLIAVAVVILAVVVFREALAGTFTSVAGCLSGSC